MAYEGRSKPYLLHPKERLPSRGPQICDLVPFARLGERRKNGQIAEFCWTIYYLSTGGDAVKGEVGYPPVRPPCMALSEAVHRYIHGNAQRSEGQFRRWLRHAGLGGAGLS